MRTLGLDTSDAIGSIALCVDDRLIAESALDMNRMHSERLMTALDHLLHALEWSVSDIEFIAVAVGPGSFSGLRVGVTTAKSLAFALNAPAIGVTTLDAIAFQNRHANRDLCVLLDALRGEVYTARYSREILRRAEREPATITPMDDYRCVRVEEVIREVRAPSTFVGNAAPLYRDEIIATLGALAYVSDAEPAESRASAVARLAWRRFASDRTTVEEAHCLAPLYMRRPPATVPDHRPVEV